MPDQNPKDERLEANTRIVTDHGIDELQPANDIHQEIYNEIIPPGGFDESRPVEYTYHRIGGSSSTNKEQNTSKGRRLSEDISKKGCQCEESLRNYCHGKDWCDNCCNPRNNLKGGSSRREELKMPDFTKMGLYGNSGTGGATATNRRSSNNDGGGSSNLNNRRTNRSSNNDGTPKRSSNGAGGTGRASIDMTNLTRRAYGSRGSYPNDSNNCDHEPFSIGSKHYTGGERGEVRGSREYCPESRHQKRQRHRRRSSRVQDDEDDEMCAEFPRTTKTPRTSTKDCCHSSSKKIARESDHFNRNRCSIGSRGNNFTVVNEAHETTDIGEDEDYPCSNHNHCSLIRTSCPPTHRLSIELSPVTSTASAVASPCNSHVVPKRWATKTGRDCPIPSKNPNAQSRSIIPNRRASSDTNANCRTPPQRNQSSNNNNGSSKICFDLTLECPNGNAGDRVLNRRVSSSAAAAAAKKAFEEYEQSCDYDEPSMANPCAMETSNSWLVQNSSLIFALIIIWLLLLSVVMISQNRPERYAGIYP